MSVVSSLQMPRRWEMGTSPGREEAKWWEKSSAFFFGAEVAVGTFSWELGKKLKNVVLNLLDFMDEMRVFQNMM